MGAPTGMISAMPPISTMSALGTTPQNQDRRALASAISAVEQSGIWPGRSMKIHFDQSTQSLTVQLINSQTNEVVEQIPSEEVLQMAQLLGNDENPPIVDTYQGAA